MLFDTDVLIWYQRGKAEAAKVIDKSPERFISAQTYMELLQCAESKQQQLLVKSFLQEFNFIILPLTENIGHRAVVYTEAYSLSHGIRAGDAIIAATAAEHNLALLSGNAKHFKVFNEITFKHFKVRT